MSKFSQDDDASADAARAMTIHRLFFENSWAKNLWVLFENSWAKNLLLIFIINFYLPYLRTNWFCSHVLWATEPPWSVIILVYSIQNVRDSPGHLLYSFVYFFQRILSLEWYSHSEEIYGDRSNNNHDANKTYVSQWTTSVTSTWFLK